MSFIEAILNKFISFTCSALILISLTYEGRSAGESANQTLPRLVGFIENVGQWPGEVLFVARQPRAEVWITRTGTVVDAYICNAETSDRSGTVTQETYIGARPSAVLGVGATETAVTFFRGGGKQQGSTARVFGSVVVADLYPGISARYDVGADLRVVRTLLVKPGADISVVKLVSSNPSDAVTASTTIVTSFVYGTYLGGLSNDEMIGVRYTSAGNVVVCGNTSALDFPGTAGGYSKTANGVLDAFVALFDKKLQKVKSYSFLGGSGLDRVRAMCIDDENSVYLTGETTSNNFPVTSGVSGQLYKASLDGFIAKFDSTLTKLLVGGYHGGNKDDSPRAIAVNQNKQIFIAGNSTSTADLPVTFPATVTIRLPFGGSRTEPGGGRNGGQSDGFIATFSSNGSLQQARYFGREGVDIITAMVVDASSSVYFTGSTTSSNFETAPTPGGFSSGRVPYDRTYNGGNTDSYVVKLNNELALAKTDDGTYSTYFGGGGEEEGRGIFVDDLGRAYVSGVTNSKNLPTVGTLVTQPIGNQDVWLAVFGDDGRELASATYFGGIGNDDVTGMVRYENTSAVIFGSTNSNDFPVTGDGSVGDRAGTSDGFFTIMNTSTNRFTTLLRGAAEDTIRSVAVDPLGDLYFLAVTNSPDLRLPDTTFDATVSGGDGYVAKFAFGILELLTPAGSEVWCVGGNRSISWSNNGIADSVRYTIEIAPAAREEWSVLAKNVSGRSYLWKIGPFETGLYRVRVVSARGHVSQLTSTFTISNPPVITAQPKNSSACLGKPLTLTVAATGVGLKYQWKKAGVDIDGATMASYTIPSVDNSTIGQYTCSLTGVCNPSVVSSSTAVSIATPTLIGTQPVGATVEQGKGFVLMVVVSGSSLAYQWRKDGSAITGATSAEYRITSAALADAGLYACEITGGCGAIQSNEVNVAVTPSTSVTEEDNHDALWLRMVGPVPAFDRVVVRTIDLATPVPTLVRVIDAEGRTVASFDMGTVGAGTTDLPISVNNIASGVYTIEVQAGDRMGRIMCVVRR